MRIAHFTDTFVPQVNGVVTSIANFSRELGRRGHSVAIFAPAPKTKGESFEAENVHVYPLTSVSALFYPEFRFTLPSLRHVLKTLRAFEPDVLHVHTPLSVGMHAVIASRALHKPLVGTNHVYLTKNNVEFLRCFSNNEQIRKQLGKIIRPLGNVFYKTCDMLLMPSELLIHELHEDGYRRPMHYLPNAVPLETRTSPSDAARRKFRVAHGLRERVIVHVGRLSKEKCVDVVLHSFAELAKTRDDASLLLIGDGPAKKELEKTAHHLGMADRVRFTGFVPHDELMNSGMLGLCDVFVTASTMESQGMVILEAMSFGIPVVAVDEGAVGEVVGESGFLTEPGDAVAIALHVDRLLSDKSLAADMARLSKQRAKQFSVNTVTTKLLGIYRQAEKSFETHRRADLPAQLRKWVRLVTQE